MGKRKPSKLLTPALEDFSRPGAKDLARVLKKKGKKAAPGAAEQLERAVLFGFCVTGKAIWYDFSATAWCVWLILWIWDGVSFFFGLLLTLWSVSLAVWSLACSWGFQVVPHPERESWVLQSLGSLNGSCLITGKRRAMGGRYTDEEMKRFLCRSSVFLWTMVIHRSWTCLGVLGLETKVGLKDMKQQIFSSTGIVFLDICLPPPLQHIHTSLLDITPSLAMCSVHGVQSPEGRVMPRTTEKVTGNEGHSSQFYLTKKEKAIEKMEKGQKPPSEAFKTSSIQEPMQKFWKE